MKTVKGDVSTIKSDVKLLLMANAQGVGIVSLLTRAAPWVAVLISVVAVASR